MPRSLRATSLAIVAASLIVLPATVASAHGDEEHGELTLSIGFGTEPAYVDQPNSVQVLATRGDEPVDDLGGPVEVEVSFGDASTTLPLEPYFEVGGWGTRGDFRAWFVPSEPGAYTFTIDGEIDGETVDVSMTSSPSTFSEVVDPAEAAFPPAASGPSADDLATRIEQEAARTADAVAAAQDAAASAREAADSARTLGIAGVLLGAAGLVVGTVALLRARRTA
jgi:hypothetical protein